MKTGKEYYTEIADNYIDTAGADYHTHRFRTFNSLIPDTPSRILDFGCGSGENLKILSDLGHTVTGMDPVEGLIDQARKHAKDVRVGDANSLERFHDQSFDVVTALSVLSYLNMEESITFYREAKRLLKPGGCLVASYSNMLVDMTTLNRHSVEFYRSHVIPFLTPDRDVQAEMLEGYKSRLAFPDEPQTRDSEIDKVIRRRRNPHLIGDELAAHSFAVDKMAFMGWLPLPPQWLNDSPYAELRFTASLPHWLGFTHASMFVVRASGVV